MVQTKHIKTGELRSFNDVQWKLLGTLNADGHKAGWKEITDQQAVEVKTVQTPQTGQKQKTQFTVDEKAKKAALHEARLAELMAIDPKAAEADLGAMPQEKFDELKQSFLDAAAREAEYNTAKANITGTAEAKEIFLSTCEEKKVTKNMIKDFLDKAEQKYDNKANLDTLTNQLGEFLAWELEKLNANF